MIIKRLVNLWIIAGLLIAVATTAAAAQDKLNFPSEFGPRPWVPVYFGLRPRKVSSRKSV